MKLVEEQVKAIEMIENATGPVRLLGPPGVGKSTVINNLTKVFRAVAPTNKAAAIIDGVTIHKLLGLTIKKHNGVATTVATKKTPIAPLPYWVVCDEASCIPRDILSKYLLRLVPKLILVGDQAQLNPVGESTIPFMDLNIPTMELTHCHRFGDEILEVAYAMRRTVFDHDAGFGVPNSWQAEFDPALLGDDDVVIAWRNETVNRYNRIVKMHKFGTTDWQVGEHVRIGSFYEAKGLATESEYNITSVTFGRHSGQRCWLIGLDNGDTVPVIHDDDREEYNERLQSLAEEQNWRAFYPLKEAFCDLRPSYAITAHKSQGSTYSNVWIDYNDIFDNPNYNEAVRAAYVATTRPRFKVRSIV